MDESTGQAAPIRRARPAAVRQRAKLAETVARAIERDILDGGWAVGAVFGGEAELMERYQTSRSVIREAIRLVEYHQIAVPRRGRGGGLIVSAPVEKSVVEAIVLFLEVVGVSLKEITDARLVLERLAIRQAVDRLDETGIAQLRASTRAEATAGICGADQQLHQVIVEIANNAVVRIYLDSLVALTRRHPWVVQSVRRDRAGAAKLPKVHQAIADAIISGDVGLAQQRMTEHLGAITKAVESPATPPAKTAGPRPTPALVVRPQFDDPALSAILADVRAHAGEPGVHLGSEPELMERYGVSRAKLRESVRILEHLGVAEMRRGTSGGLVITEPEPDGVATTVAMYLEYYKASATDLQEARVALELYTVGEVVEHLDDQSVERLLEVQRIERRAGDDLVTAVDDGTYALSLASRFHLRLADLSGNRAVQVFARPLIALTSGRRRAETSRPSAADRQAAAVREAHQGIAEAILAGDRDLAVHRMRKHLNAVFSVTNRG